MSQPCIKLHTVNTASLVMALSLVMSQPVLALTFSSFSGLGDLFGGGFFSQARGVSADGSVIVGESISTNGTEAFRYTTSSGMVGLGDLANGNFFSRATSVSSDGNVIVGRGTSASGTEAFRYSTSEGMVGLGDLAGGSFSSIAFGVSSDGNVIVGQGTSDNGNEAFRYTESDGMVGLGDLDGGDFFSQARGVSFDGSVIVGNSNSANGAEAFVWDAIDGMQSIRDQLIASGFDLTGWTNLTGALAISTDGSTIVGYGTHNNNTEAFVTRLDTSPVPIPAAVWLMGSALLGLVGLGRKKSNA